MTQRELTIYNNYLGYQSRTEETNADPRTFAPGSQNVFVDYNSAVRQRLGITTAGQDLVTLTGTIGAYMWRTKSGLPHSLKRIGANIYRLHKTVTESTTTYTWDTVGSVSDDSGSNDFTSWVSVWDDVNKQSALIMGVGNQYINFWTGGFGVVESTTATTITIDTTVSLTQRGFRLATSGTTFANATDIGSFTYTGFTTSDTTTSTTGAVTFATDDVVTTVGAYKHLLGSNTPVKFTTTGTLAAPLVPDQQYYLRDVTDTTFKLSATPTGAVIDITTTGSGTHTLHFFTGVLDTFTGVTMGTQPAVGVRVYEPIVSTINSSLPLPQGYTIDFVGVFRNSLYVGSKNSRNIFSSNGVDAGSLERPFLNFATSTSPGGGRQFVIDDTCAGFSSAKDSMVIFGTDEALFNVTVLVSADQSKELFEVNRLLAAPQNGLASPNGWVRVKNSLLYLTKEKTLDELKFVENIVDLQAVPISDIVKADFDALDIDTSVLFYHERNLYTISPNDNKIMWYDKAKEVWQAPIIPGGAVISLFSIDEDGNLLGHDRDSGVSYFMFSGASDNGQAIASKAIIAYNNFGAPYKQKTFTQYVQDGYISTAGILTRTIEYDFEGVKGENVTTFEGSDERYVYRVQDGGGLGQVPLGERSLAGAPLLDVPEENRFRFSDPIPAREFYEMRVTYEMEVNNATWSLVRHGADVVPTNTGLNDITRI